MMDRELTCLLKKKEVITQDLRPKYILPFLEDVLNINEIEDILKQPKQNLQVDKLINILSSKGPGAFVKFINALNSNDTYPWIASELRAEFQNNNRQGEPCTNVNYKLQSGGFPFPIETYVVRTQLLQKIRDYIVIVLQSQRGWVVLNGMQGTGKSVLAGEVFRDKQFHDKHFLGQIWWVQIGSVNNREDGDLLLKMHNLCDKLGLNKPVLPTTVEMATDRLKKKMTESRYRNSFIVLDDVKESFVIKAFDVGCPVLVTSKNKSIVDDVSGKKCYINVDGLNMEESLELLSMSSKTERSLLAKEEEKNMKSIIEKCKGSPFVLSLIGRLVSHHSNKNEKLKSCLTHLEGGHISRIRRLSGDTSLHCAIELSVQELDTEMRKYFYDFALFPEDVYIPNKVLEVLWDKERMDVEDIMYYFIDKSLARRKEDKNFVSYYYGIHDLHLAYLKEKCEDEVELHSRLLEKYLKLCEVHSDDGVEFDYTLLPDDGYIYFYLAFHIYKSGKYSLFEDIYLNLKFVQKKIWITGLGDLFHDYDVYDSYFGKAQQKKRDLESFIHQTGALLCEDKIDIIQLALCRPSDTTVYQDGKAIAEHKTPNKIYLEWCNSMNVPFCDMLHKVHLGAVNSVAFSRDDKIVASAGEDNVVRLWDSTTGKVKQILKGHSEAIKCCTFSQEGTLLATASSDKTVKLWSLNLQQLASQHIGSERRASIHGTLYPLQNGNSSSHPNNCVFEFTEHSAEVLCCAFSHDESLVVSSDDDGLALVWDRKSGDVKLKLSHEGLFNSHIVCCAFSPDSTIIATASYNEIRLWTLDGLCKACLVHEKKCIMTFCFTKNGEQLISCAGSFVWCWDVKNSQLLNKYNDVKESYYVSCCTLSPDDEYIAAGTTNKSVMIWNRKSRQRLVKFKGRGDIQSLAYSNDGSRLVSSAEDGTIMVMDVKKRMSTSMVDLTQNISVQFLEDQPVIAISDEHNCIQILTGLDGALLKRIYDVGEVSSCSLSPNCVKVAYGSKCGNVKVYTVDSESTHTYKGHAAEVTCIVFSKDSTFFVTCSADGKLKAWFEDNTCYIFQGHSKEVIMCKLFQEDTHILSCSEDGTIKVWKIVEEDNCLVTCCHGEDRVTCCDISADEKFFLSSSVDQTVKLWDLRTGELMRTFDCETCFRCCKFSPKGNFIAAGNDSGEALVWDIREGKCAIPPKILNGHTIWVNDLAFSPDETRLVAVSDCIKWWQFGDDCSGTELQTFKFRVNKICAIFHSEDFSTFVAVDGGTLYILKILS